MLEQDLKTYLGLGRSLWSTPEASFTPMLDAIAGASVATQDGAVLIERASTALLTRSLVAGIEATADRVAEPFFRLSPDERVLLVGLHHGRWSYSRMSRILGTDAAASLQDMPRLAWKARMHLASQIPGLNYPTGSARNGMSCPDYDPEDPWTQRFLDEELSQRERVFLQTHVQGCSACQKALNSCRNLYYAVEKWIPTVAEYGRDQQMMKRLKTAARQVRHLYHPHEMTLGQALVTFTLRPETLTALGVGACLVYILSRFH